MKITVTSLMDDDRKSTKILHGNFGVSTEKSIPLGEANRLTVVSREEPDGVELLLEPSGFEPAMVYRKALYEAGIPATVFSVMDIGKECERLRTLGVEFTMEPQQMGTVILAVFDDTCGIRFKSHKLYDE